MTRSSFVQCPDTSLSIAREMVHFSGSNGDISRDDLVVYHMDQREKKSNQGDFEVTENSVKLFYNNVPSGEAELVLAVGFFTTELCVNRWIPSNHCLQKP